MPSSLNWVIEPLPLELAYTWRISRNASDKKNNFIIKVTDGTTIGMGEVAPNVRYNETPEIVVAAFKKLEQILPSEVISVTELLSFLDAQQLPNALDFGIRSAYQHFISGRTGIDICSSLGVQRLAQVPTSFSVPIMDIEKLQPFLIQNQVQRFPWVKLKVNRENLVETVRETARLVRKPLLLDGNEAWNDPDELISQLGQLSGLNVVLLEQPMPADRHLEYEYLKNRSPFPLLADESVTDHADMEVLKKQFHGINVKLMKARCYYNAINILQQAKQNGMFTMLGCMIESTLGISSAMNVASLANYIDLDGFLLIKKEPFHLVTEENGYLTLAT